MTMIYFSRDRALFTLYAKVPFLIVLTLLIATSFAVMAATPLGLKGMSDRGVALISVLCLTLFIVHAWVAADLIRNRETLFTTFQVTSTGITVEDARYGQLVLNCNDVTRATYRRFLGSITLDSPRLLKPIAIMNPTPRNFSPEFEAARELIGEALHAR
jgi:hypothetical protein